MGALLFVRIFHVNRYFENSTDLIYLYAKSNGGWTMKIESYIAAAPRMRLGQSRTRSRIIGRTTEASAGTVRQAEAFQRVRLTSEAEG